MSLNNFRSENTIVENIFQRYTGIPVKEVLKELQTSKNGLDSLEVSARLLRYGHNVLKVHSVSWWFILLRQFKSPFIYLLLFAVILAFFLGEFIDGLLILIFVLINASLGFFQEFRSDQALKMLQKYISSHARLIRDGKAELVEISNIVPGDIIQLQPGDVISADIRLFESNGLNIDESALTGESESVLKTEGILYGEKLPIHKALNIAFSGSSVVSGEGLGVVIATGSSAYIGNIVKLAVETTRVSSFEKGMGKFSGFVLRMVGITLSIVFFANLVIKGPDAQIVDLIIFAIALATAVIPEALPLVITFSLSRGALKLAKHKVVVKRLSAIEDLGGIEVLCTDKTGTITENKLQVVSIYGSNRKVVLYQAAVASDQKNIQKDPFDRALKEVFKKIKANLQFAPVLRELPFDPERKRNSVIVQSGNKKMLIVRGADEFIMPFITGELSKQFKSWIESQENQGRRVIVVAHKIVKNSKEYTKELEEGGLTFTGALAFSDTLKRSTPSAIKKARALGVQVKIITGDSSRVAGAVAYAVGLASSPREVISAVDFFALSNLKQKQAADKFNVFARFSPAQKNQLIDVLQQKYEVGFLGEGINDAPALKSANVALAVQGASDISREVADIILLNRSLGVIVDGIQEGREVFSNTIKYVKMTLASNFGNFYAVAIASLIVKFLPMLPIQILLVNLLSDFPLITIATDSVDPEEIRSPENYNIKDFALIATLLGLVSTVFDFIFFGLFYKISPEVLQTNWFIGSILTELALLYSLRTRRPFYKAAFPSKIIVSLTIIAALATVLIPYTSIGASLFHFSPPSILHLVLIIYIVVLYFLSTEAVKLAYYRLMDGKVSEAQRVNP